MSKLVPIELDDGTVIYIESTEEIVTPEIEAKTGESAPVAKGSMDTAVEKFKSIQSTIQSYSVHTLNAFKELAVANVDKVTLEFGIKVGGEAGIPYVTKGTAESNLKITVECSFPKSG